MHILTMARSNRMGDTLIIHGCGMQKDASTPRQLLIQGADTLILEVDLQILKSISKLISILLLRFILTFLLSNLFIQYFCYST